ncbi:periplasmic heavy metal sensor [uncultured Roseobacter sp.]|uniref:Spy/CpxP family protein refolding chaperone n=1 Tax=uncultured Roseobacter sp. TaxID=114847 RepID=UPI002603129E|nr:periplasmic heavy metal sensor [uncultured Roseobacter sp.]
MRRHIFIGFAASVLSIPVLADDSHTPYAGMESRDIATLSESDISELEAGRGWGLALAAELNGHPGPAHVLKLAEQLSLSSEQRERVEDIFGAIQAEAVAAGAVFIAAERALDTAFSNGGVNAAKLETLVNAAGQARSNLRFVHLSRHLETLDILSPHQIARYNDLRGYTNDPCAQIPDGRDPEMWRRHNGCDR